MTSDCYKRICLLSKTQKAEFVRSYYLQLEKLVDKYKDYIIRGLNKQLDIYKNNQKPIIDVKSGVIYVFAIASIDSKIKYKIGKSENVKHRVNTHNSSHPDNVEILFYYEVDDVDQVENCLKTLLKTHQYRKNREFYETDLDTIKNGN